MLYLDRTVGEIAVTIVHIERAVAADEAPYYTIKLPNGSHFAFFRIANGCAGDENTQPLLRCHSFELII